MQDVVFRADNVCFHKEKYWAASTGETYLAPLPRGYEGQFGPGLKALTLTLYFGGNISEPKILDLYENIGIQVSAGQLSKLLIKDQEAFHAEKAALSLLTGDGLPSVVERHRDPDLQPPGGNPPAQRGNVVASEIVLRAVKLGQKPLLNGRHGVFLRVLDGGQVLSRQVWRDDQPHVSAVLDEGRDASGCHGEAC